MGGYGRYGRTGRPHGPKIGVVSVLSKPVCLGHGVSYPRNSFKESTGTTKSQRSAPICNVLPQYFSLKSFCLNTKLLAPLYGNRRKTFCFREASPTPSPTRGSVPGHRWRLCPRPPLYIFIRKKCRKKNKKVKAKTTKVYNRSGSKGSRSTPAPVTNPGSIPAFMAICLVTGS